MCKSEGEMGPVEFFAILGIMISIFFIAIMIAEGI